MIEHVATGRRYIGKSIDVEGRLRDHLKLSGPRKSGSHLRRAIAKYGRDSFKCTVLEECKDEATALLSEIFWIAFLDTKSPYGFNLTDGGEGVSGAVPSEETRAKISAGNRGKAVSAETRAKIGAASRARVCTDEARANMSASRRGRTHTPETRAKMSAALMGNSRGSGHTISAATRAKMNAGRRKETGHG